MPCDTSSDEQRAALPQPLTPSYAFRTESPRKTAEAADSDGFHQPFDVLPGNGHVVGLFGVTLDEFDEFVLVLVPDEELTVLVPGFLAAYLFNHGQSLPPVGALSSSTRTIIMILYGLAVRSLSVYWFRFDMFGHESPVSGPDVYTSRLSPLGTALLSLLFVQGPTAIHHRVGYESVRLGLAVDSLPVEPVGM